MNALILAGGKSERMGCAKALLVISAKTLLEHQAFMMRPCVERLFISSHLPVSIQDVEMIDDSLPGHEGPLSGILPALFMSQSECLWIMPCDCFGFDHTLLEQLTVLLEKSGTDIAYLQCDGREHPLMAVWRPNVVHALQDFINEGGRSVLKWYATQNVSVLDWQQKPTEFFNINTPEQFQALVEAVC